MSQVANPLILSFYKFLFILNCVLFGVLIGGVAIGVYSLNQRLNRLEIQPPQVSLSDELTWKIIYEAVGINKGTEGFSNSLKSYAPVSTVFVVDIFVGDNYRMGFSTIDSIKAFFEEISDGVLSFSEGYEPVGLEQGIAELSMGRENYANKGNDLVLFATGSFTDDTLEFYIMNPQDGEYEFLYRISNYPRSAPLKLIIDKNEAKGPIQDGILSILRGRERS